MQREWRREELGVVDAGRSDWRLVGNKSGATRLGFALLLKFFEIEVRFPHYAEEIPPQALDYVAEQVGMSAMFSQVSGISMSTMDERTGCRARWCPLRSGHQRTRHWFPTTSRG